MLVPLRLSGWAQVALTPACSRRDANQTGSHWSWQSHRKLPLCMRLEKKVGGGRGSAAASNPTQEGRSKENSQAFEALHFSEGIGLDGADGVVSQVPGGHQRTITD